MCYLQDYSHPKDENLFKILCKNNFTRSFNLMCMKSDFSCLEILSDMVFKFFWQACSSSVPLQCWLPIDKVCQKNSNTKSVKITNQEQFGFNRYTFGLDYDLKCKWTWQAYRESETPTDCYLKCIEFLMRYIRECVKFYLFMRFPFLLLSCS
jgi:hypothetical protein